MQHKPKMKKTKTLRVKYGPQSPISPRFHDFQNRALDSFFLSALPAFVSWCISSLPHSEPKAGTVTSSAFPSESPASSLSKEADGRI